MKIALLILATLLVLVGAVNAEAKIVSRTVPYHHGETELEGYLAYDDSIAGKRPGVLVIHEWWGLNDYIRKRADQLAQAGFVAFAADMYGKGKVTEHPKEAGEWAKLVRSNIDLWRSRAKAGLEVLAKEPLVDPARIAAIGYCFGGSTVQQLAYTGADIKGVVSFHGALIPPGDEQARQVRTKILICHGAADQSTKPEGLQNYIASMEKSGLDWQMIIYGGAKHSFTNPNADKRGMPNLGYNKAADARSWADMMVFFKEIF